MYITWNIYPAIFCVVVVWINWVHVIDITIFGKVVWLALVQSYIYMSACPRTRGVISTGYMYESNRQQGNYDEAKQRSNCVHTSCDVLSFDKINGLMYVCIYVSWNTRCVFHGCQESSSMKSNISWETPLWHYYDYDGTETSQENNV